MLVRKIFIYYMVKKTTIFCISRIRLENTIKKDKIKYKVFIMDLPQRIANEFAPIGISFNLGRDGERYILNYKGFIRPIEEDGGIIVDYGFFPDFWRGQGASRCELEIITAAIYSSPLDGFGIKSKIREFNNSTNRPLNNQLEFFIDSQRILALGFKTTIQYIDGHEEEVRNKIQQYAKEFVQALLNREDIKETFDLAATESVMMNFFR